MQMTSGLSVSRSFQTARVSVPRRLAWPLAPVLAVVVLGWPVSAQGVRGTDVRNDLGRVGEGERPRRGVPSLPRFGAAAGAAGPEAPVYKPDNAPGDLQKEFERENYKRDLKSGNYLSPKVLARTLDQNLVPVQIDGKYVKDLKGQTIFLRQSIRDKVLLADAAMFAKKQQHIVINYGFRSNALQRDLFKKLSGVGRVAPPGGSFHETGMAMDIQNWRDAQKFMIEAGFVGGCYGIEEDLVHYSIGEITKGSNMSAFKRCTLKEIPQNILKGVKKVGSGVGGVVGIFKKK
ncbi:MAG: M15 family metallopeptidase [Acidobacteriota bacterium]